MNLPENTYQILKLTPLFYETYLNESQTEILQKKTRAYTKIVILDKTEYLNTKDAIINKDEYNETIQNLEKIKSDDLSYVEEYIEKIGTDDLSNDVSFDRKYK